METSSDSLSNADPSTDSRRGNKATKPAGTVLITLCSILRPFDPHKETTLRTYVLSPGINNLCQLHWTVKESKYSALLWLGLSNCETMLEKSGQSNTRNPIWASDPDFPQKILKTAAQFSKTATQRGLQAPGGTKFKPKILTA